MRPDKININIPVLLSFPFNVEKPYFKNNIANVMFIIGINILSCLGLISAYVDRERRTRPKNI